jgi:hypothetical protein
VPGPGGNAGVRREPSLGSAHPPRGPSGGFGRRAILLRNPARGLS